MIIQANLDRVRDEYGGREIGSRDLEVRSSTLDRDGRSVEVVMTTDFPATVIDWSRYEVVEEVLAIDGAIIPPTRQVPLLESHRRWSTADVVGSARDISVEGGKLVGRMHFDSGPDGGDIFRKIADGHITDVSIGYRVNHATYIEPGKSAVVNGRNYKAKDITLKVSTEWEVKELSVVPIGADPYAKVREEHTAPQRAERVDAMPTQGNHEQNEKSISQNVVSVNDSFVDTDKIREDSQKSERKRVSDIAKLCDDENMARSFISRAIDRGWSVEETAEIIKDIREYHKENNGANIKQDDGLEPENFPVIEVGAGPQGKFLSGGEAVLLERMGIKSQDKEAIAIGKDLQSCGLQDFARLSIELAGKRPPTNKRELFKTVIGTPDGQRIGNLSILLNNTANKALRASYDEKLTTFSQISESVMVSDFKINTEVNLSALGEPPEMPRGAQFEHKDMKEAAETYRVKTYGEKFAITEQDFIDDNLGGFLRMPRKIGNAFARHEDTVGYAFLTQGTGAVGPVMSQDSKNLFSATHTVTDDSKTQYTNVNYITGAASALSDSSLSTAKKNFMKTRGLNGEILNLVPRVLLVPSSLEHTAKKLLISSQMMIASETGAGSTTLAPSSNVWVGAFQLVVEPRLDAISETGWYLICSPMDNTTLINIRLQGQIGPQIESRASWDYLGMEWRSWNHFGVGVTDYRGILYSKGSA